MMPVILYDTREQSMLKKIKSSFEAKNMKTKYCLLGYRIDSYFQDYRFAIEIDENRHSDKNIYYEIRRQKKLLNKNLVVIS